MKRCSARVVLNVCSFPLWYKKLITKTLIYYVTVYTIQLALGASFMNAGEATMLGLALLNV